MTARSAFLLFTLLVFMLDAGTAEAKKRRHKKRDRDRAAASAGMNCKNPTDAKTCMVCNCFNEAGNESYKGQVAVGKVVMTRVGMSGYPKSVCGVIKQKSQFSWFNKKSTRRSVPRGHSCNKASAEALKFRGYFADHYYASYIRKPRWARNMRGVQNIGLHRFFASASPRNNDAGEQAAAARGVAMMILRIPALAGLIDGPVMLESSDAQTSVPETI